MNGCRVLLYRALDQTQVRWSPKIGHTFLDMHLRQAHRCEDSLGMGVFRGSLVIPRGFLHILFRMVHPPHVDISVRQQ
jgi:hypothetical protein